MKKIIMAILGLFIIISFATTASAADGAAISISDAGGTGGALDFNPSSSTSIGAFTAENTFTIVAASTKAGENAIIYGVISTENVIYQASVDLSDTSVTLPTSATALPTTDTSDWKTKSGSTPP
ncbi:MAG: hypothetical protein PF690_15485 [Deltaproteobacteria bacterium]|jgi:hypothetical protein|nr:hypothetical protein [Deltaproteobacteria bacterium]